ADIARIGDALDITARLTGAVVTITVVGVIMCGTSLTLGLVVLIGVPLLLAAIGPLLKPLHHRQHRYRDQQTELTERATDIVAGLRVLRGIGGEASFLRRYREESQRVRGAGVRVAQVESLLESAEILLPGLFVVTVVWLGARMAITGQITPGQLVAF